MRDVVEKVVTSKLGMNLPLITHGSSLLYEVGDDLDQDMVANYEANLEKVLSELPYAITGGTIITVEDLQQELVCNINIKHKFVFDFYEEGIYVFFIYMKPVSPIFDGTIAASKFAIVNCFPCFFVL
ncbi:hypothetical protein LXL04_033493 [Taraxacum kok-saghyz]